MAKIAVVGAGVIGCAFVKIVLAVTAHEVVLIDTRESQLRTALRLIIETMSENIAERIEAAHCPNKQSLAEKIVEVDLVACCTPFSEVAEIAALSAAHSKHYLDFTEDNEVTEEINQLKVEKSTFVPQTGIAPGLINYMGIDLSKGLEVSKLKLCVGALPQEVVPPSYYAITWSPAGLVNEYLKPVKQKVDGQVITVEPLTDLEILMVDNETYEAFTTSGGVGNLAAYSGIPNIEYKTLRHPGHHEFLIELLRKARFNQEIAEELITTTFERTRLDKVATLIRVVCTNGTEHFKGDHFWPNASLDLTAIELMTAGTGVAVAELILRNKLPKGILRPDQIPLNKLFKTGSGRLLDSARIRYSISC